MEQLQHDSIRLAQTNAKLIDRLKNESNGFISNSFVDSLPNEATVKQNFEDYTNKIISHITRLQENDLNKEVELNNESHKIFILEQRVNQLQIEISDLEYKLNMERNKIAKTQIEENELQIKQTYFKNDKALVNETIREDKVNKIFNEIKKRYSDYNNESNNSNACSNNRSFDNSNSQQLNASGLSQISNHGSFLNRVNYNDNSSSLFKDNSVYGLKLNSTSTLTDSSLKFFNRSNRKQ